MERGHPDSLRGLSSAFLLHSEVSSQLSPISSMTALVSPSAEAEAGSGRGEGGAAVGGRRQAPGAQLLQLLAACGNEGLGLGQRGEPGGSHRE